MEIYRLVFSPIEVNTYIITEPSGTCAVIDCGCYNRHEFDALVQFIDKNNLKPVLLLNTHCHLDHIFGNKLFLEKYGIGMLCHPLEEENRIDAVPHSKLFGLSMETPPEPAGHLSDGDEVTFGNVRFSVLYVPGHTRGGIAFHSIEAGVVFTGDTLFSGSIGRTDLPGGDYETIIHSIKTRLFTLPPLTVVYPGHGEATTIETELKTNPYFTGSNS
jgi:hydroxyacylglutathione hydrolase